MLEKDEIRKSKDLFLSAQNILRSSPDINALIQSVCDKLLAQEYEPNCKTSEESHSDIIEGDDWVYSASYYSLNIENQERRKTCVSGTISIIFQLCHQETASESELLIYPWLNKACVIIGWCKDDDRWTSDNFSIEYLERLKHVCAGLWSWKEPDDEANYGYFFILPIFCLKDENDIQRKLIIPLKKLYGADNPSKIAGAVFTDVPVLMPENE